VATCNENGRVFIQSHKYIKIKSNLIVSMQKFEEFSLIALIVKNNLTLTSWNFLAKMICFTEDSYGSIG